MTKKREHETDQVHKTHSDIVKRLKRAAGHLSATITMIENKRSCLDLAQQLHAIESAVAQAKKTLIHDHIDHCLGESAGHGVSSQKSLKEFKEITKYL